MENNPEFPCWEVYVRISRMVARQMESWPTLGELADHHFQAIGCSRHYWLQVLHQVFRKLPSQILFLSFLG